MKDCYCRFNKTYKFWTYWQRWYFYEKCIITPKSLLNIVFTKLWFIYISTWTGCNQLYIACHYSTEASSLRFLKKNSLPINVLVLIRNHTKYDLYVNKKEIQKVVSVCFLLFSMVKQNYFEICDKGKHLNAVSRDFSNVGWRWRQRRQEEK